jgi:hypothetical protein
MTERRNPNKGRRRGRQPRNRNNGSSKTPWQVQQTKLTVRRLPFHSAAQILTVVGNMIAHVNAESNLPIKLDMASVEKIIADEQLVLSSQAKDENDGITQMPDDATNGHVLPVVKATEQLTMVDVVNGATGVSLEGPFITARALYVVPAKTSRRRGEKHGCAYFVLTAPAPPFPPPQPPVKVPAAVDVAVNGRTANTTRDGGDAMKVDSAAPNTDKNGAIQTEVTVKAPMKEAIGLTKTMTPMFSAAEKSRLSSLAKLQLLQAIESLSALAEEDAKTAQLYGKCQIEASVNGKTWRDKETRDRREVAVENTNDFKLFFTKQVRATEERQSRPKPLPGGGVGHGENGADSDQKLAAIVLHLRAKRNEEANRKKVKKPAIKEANAGKQQRYSASTVNTNAKKDLGKGRTNHVIKGGNGGVVRGHKGKTTISKKKSEAAGTPSPVVPSKNLPKGSG